VGPSLLKTCAVNFLNQQLLLKMLWELFKNNQWCFSSYHIKNLKHGFISLFQVTFWDESTIAVLDDRVQTVCQVQMRNFCQHIWKRQAKFLSRSCMGGNVSLWTIRFHIILTK